MTSPDSLAALVAKLRARTPHNTYDPLTLIAGDALSMEAADAISRLVADVERLQGERDKAMQTLLAVHATVIDAVDQGKWDIVADAALLARPYLDAAQAQSKSEDK